MTRISLVVLLALCLGLVACGKKDMPVPMGAIHPKSINDLQYIITPNGVELNWTIPTRNVDGSPILALKGFELYKAVISEDSCKGCPIAFESPVFLPMETVSKSGQKMFYEDRTLKKGQRYAFEIRTVKAFMNRSEPSNRVIFTWHPPASPPSQPIAVSMVDGLGLSWSPPLTWTDGTALNLPVFYRVYVQKEDEDGWKLIKDRLSSPSFIHLEAKTLNKPLRYRITAVSDHNGTLIESAPSPEVTAEFISPVQPNAPTGLVAILRAPDTGKSRVELFWQDVSDSNVVGYVVYRRASGTNEFKRLNEHPLSIVHFDDETVLPPGVYEYRVTAVSRAGKESEPSSSATIRIYE